MMFSENSQISTPWPEIRDSRSKDGIPRGCSQNPLLWAKFESLGLHVEGVLWLTGTEIAFGANR
jgi:hypothetical protein